MFANACFPTSLAIDPPLAIEVVEGQVTRRYGTRNSEVQGRLMYIANTVFPNELYLGASVGAASSSSFGTLGFKVKLEIANQEDQIMAVTCHHVVSGTFFESFKLYFSLSNSTVIQTGPSP